ncbi:MAG TPA: Do family serine endopeptidase [Pyrinomonadaceae bacterium]|jgi:serine protease Do|nr:Do family serine endopeptidase [Pyrinomonadaceae bacterium]
MFELPQGQTNDSERAVLRKLRVWIAALAVACLVIGIGIGAILSGRPTIAQSDAQIARAPEALSASFSEIARRVEPAVVNIDTVSLPEAAERGEEEEDEEEESKGGPSRNPLFDTFRNRRRAPTKGVGSGFVVDPKGYILTNQHVVDNAARITVRLQSGEEMRGRVVGLDEETDIAVIKVEPGRDLPTLKLGNANNMQVGDWVLAVGSPFGLDQTVTAGIISTKERQTISSGFVRFLQTDAAINRGNSGGPLVNMHGEVIGINSQIATTSGDYNGIGFAVPANEAAFVYQQLVANGKVRRGYLGINLESVKAEFARVYGLPEARGVVVSDVRDGSPALKAGLQPNDVIVELNGQPIADARDLMSRIAGTPVGQSVQLIYLRDVNGKLDRRSTSVSVAERPAPSSLFASQDRQPTPAKPEDKAQVAPVKLGIKLSELTPQLAADRNLNNVRGLLIKDVDPSGIAADANLREGQVITRINRVSVSTLGEFERVIGGLKPGDPIVLNVAVSIGGRVEQRVVQFTYQ